MYLGKAHHDASGPTFCWHCNKDLMPKPGGGVFFTLVVDRAQAEHRVHKACVRDVTAEGWTKLKGGQDGQETAPAGDAVR